MKFPEVHYFYLYWNNFPVNVFYLQLIVHAQYRKSQIYFDVSVYRYIEKPNIADKNRYLSIYLYILHATRQQLTKYNLMKQTNKWHHLVIL
jgi:hypothetical protein